MNEKIKPKKLTKGSYGKRFSTMWLESCEYHLSHCDDPNCHIRKLCEMINS